MPRLRSLLFVPGDRPDRMEKALSSGADALILDLEDAVAIDAKPRAREAAAAFLARPRDVPLFVRINPLDSFFIDDDLAAVLGDAPDGIVLPKAEGADSLRALDARLSGETMILPIVTETPAAVFATGRYSGVTPRLAGLTWAPRICPPQSAPRPRARRTGDTRLPTNWRGRSPCSVPTRRAWRRSRPSIPISAISTGWPPMPGAGGATAFRG